MTSSCFSLRIALVAGIVLTISTVEATAAASLELYGTFHSMGVIAHLAATDDPDQDATAQVEYRLAGSGPYQAGHPLTRVASTRFVGSLFWLTPGTTYDVRLTFSDPDGGPLNAQVPQGTGATRSDLTIPAPTSTLTVSVNGSGSACTSASPCALATALGQAFPGQEVVLAAGVYHLGGLSLPRSGTASAPILIRGQSSTGTILDGADPASFSWASQGAGVYSTSISVANPQVAANGQRLYPYATLSDLQTLRWGVAGFWSTGSALYVRLPNDADPNGATMAVSRESHAFSVTRDYIYFRDLTFRNYGQGSYAKALYFNGASHGLVRNCQFEINGVGVALKGGAGENVVEDSRFVDTTHHWDWSAQKASGLLEASAVQFYDPTTGRGNIIRRNQVSDGFDGIRCAPSNTAAQTNETDVYENTVFAMGDDAIVIDGASSNVRVWSNSIRDALVAVSLAPAYTGPTYIIGNTFHHANTGSSPYTGTPFKFNSGSGGSSGMMYLYHNTVDTISADENAMHIQSPGSWAGIVSRNNVYSSTDYAIRMRNAGQPLDFDYDLVYSTKPNRLAYWDGLADKQLNDLAELNAQTGQELNGFEALPEFRNVASGDYTPSAAGNLVDRGVLLPGINHAYHGSAPDLGAIERPDGGGPSCPTMVASASPSSSCVGNAIQLDATLTGGSVSYSYSWDFNGDGTFDATGLSSPATSHSFASPGAFAPRVRATGAGCTVEDTTSIAVGAGPTVTAIADGSSAPIAVCQGCSVAFAAAFTGATSFSWDFDGDGNFDVTGLTTPERSHAYGAAGAYVARIRATGTCGSVESTVAVTVLPAGSATPGIVLVGLGDRGAGSLESFSGQAPHGPLGALSITWPGYNQARGESRPTPCQLDDDPGLEIVIGLGRGGGGWLEVRDDRGTGYQPLAWLQVPWSSYNAADGSTEPACGELDGDAYDEIVVGLGPGSAGSLAVFDDASAGYAQLDWLQVPWAAYNASDGRTHPAVGNLDSDPQDEIAIGLGPGGGGWLYFVDTPGLAPLVVSAAGSWLQLPWAGYNTTHGATHPALGDLDGDGLDELVVGLGAGGLGWLWAADVPGLGPLATAGSNGWFQLDWPSYNQAHGATYPTIGNLDGDPAPELVIGLAAAGGPWFEVRDDLATGLASSSWGALASAPSSYPGGTRPIVVP